MADRTQIEQILRQALPAEQQGLVPHLVAMLGGLVSGSLTIEQAQEEVAGLPGAERAREALISFAGAQSGDVQIGAIANRDIVTLYQNIFLQQGKGVTTAFYGDYVLPPLYIEREHILVQIRDHLVKDQDSLSSSSSRARRPLVLHGMGGIGKTVLARAICDDPAVRTAFPDGIFWVTLGQQPDILRPLRAIIEQLGGVVSDHAPTPRGLKAQLSGLLEQKACLIVADDLWHKEDAELLRIGGSRCQLLVTVRDSALMEGMGSQVLSVPFLEPDQALRLLHEWADGATTNLSESLLQQLIQRLGALPLALKLAGSQLRRTTAQRWLDEFDIRKLRDRRPTQLHDSLELTFSLSLDQLGAEHELYTALAIFNRDELVPINAIMRLWFGLAGIEEQECVELLEDLAARALIDLHLVEGKGTVSLHALLRDLLNTKLESEARQNAHQALLTTYRGVDSQRHWSSVSDDGYFYDHLVSHLIAVQAHDELTKLFADQRWMRVRVEQRSYSYEGYIEDLEAALAFVQAKLMIGIEREDLSVFSEFFRLLLIRTSINSLVFNYSPAILQRAVEFGIWSIDHARVVARNAPNIELQVMYCHALLEHLPEGNTHREGLVELALRNVRENSLLEPPVALSELGPHLRKAQLNDALSFAARYKQPFRKTDYISRLAAYLPLEQCEVAFQELLDDVAKIGTELLRLRCLEIIVAKAPTSVLDTTLLMATSITQPDLRALALKGLHDKMPEKVVPLIEQMVQEAYLNLARYDHSRALAILGQYVEKEAQKQIFGLVVDILRQPRDEHTKYNLLCDLMEWVTGPEREVLLEPILALEHLEYRVDGLLRLVQLSDEQLRDLLKAIVPTLLKPVHKARLLCKLTMHIPEAEHIHILAEALEATLRLPVDEPWLAQLACDLVPFLADEDRITLMRRALRSVFIVPRYNREDLLKKLIPFFNMELFEEALRETRTIRDASIRLSPLLRLSASLSKHERRSLLTDFLVARLNDATRGGLLWAVHLCSSQMLQEQREHIIATLYGESRPNYYVSALAVMLPDWQQSLSTEIIHQALEMLDRLDNPDNGLRLFDQLVRQSHCWYGGSLLLAMRRLSDDYSRSYLYSTIIAHHFNQIGQERYIALIQGDWEDRDQSWEKQVELEGYGAEHFLRDTLSEALALRTPASRAVVIRTIIALCPPTARDRIIDRYMRLISELDDSTERFFGLQSILNYLLPSQYDKFLSAIFALEKEGFSAQLLWQIAHLLTPEQLTQSVKHVAIYGDLELRALLLAHLATYVRAESATTLRQDALVAAETALEKTGRAVALANIASQWPRDVTLEVIERAIEQARAIAQPLLKAEALTVLAQHLPAPANAVVFKEAIVASEQLPFEYRRIHNQVLIAYTRVEPFRGLQLVSLLSHEQSRAHILRSIIKQTSLIDTSQLLALIKSLHSIQDKAQVIQLLAAYSDSVPLAELLTLSATLEYPRARAETMRVIAETAGPLEPADRKMLFRACVSILYDCAAKDRSHLLTTAASVLSPTQIGLPLASKATFAAHIIEVCEQWDWL